MISLRFYRIYDIGREIDLSCLDDSLSQDYNRVRTKFVRVKQKSIMMEEPPIMIQMQPITLERDGAVYDFIPVAKVFDIGAISLCFIYESPTEDFQKLENLAFELSYGEALGDLFVQYLMKMGEAIRSYIKNFAINPDFYESYSIYITDTLKEGLVDPVPLLIGERLVVSQETRKEILKHTISYTEDDRVILSWDSAILCNSTIPTDEIDLIEYACVQVLELRYYDRELSLMMEKMYDDIEIASQSRSLFYGKSRKYSPIMAKQMETAAEISEVVEKLDNLIKVTEDVYYARVYETALSVLRGHQWSASMSRKIAMIRDNYSMLSDEVRIQHSNFLEIIIIFLITCELAVSLYFHSH